MLAGGASFARPPGTEYEYSNLGWVLLGWAVSNLVGARVQDFISGELLGPLGLTSTGWDLPAGDDVMTGHRWRDGEWLEEKPPLRDGDFAVMGGLWSTVQDLSGWMTFFMDAFPPRDDADTHPLSRASRREMQHVHRAWRSAFAQQNGRLNAGGYGFGLMVTHDLRFGHIVGHPGGLPGYGSHMRWLPDRGVGIVALGNLTYAPMGLATLEALEALDDAALIPPRAVPLSPDLVRAQDGLVRLLRRWDDGLADELFAGNVFLDCDRDHRRERLARLRDRLGEFRAGDLTADGALRGRFKLMGGELSAAVTMMLSPEVPARIMSYDLSVEGEGDERGH
jgi:CubicO group peptidase (beta-lactamase class C family)